MKRLRGARRRARRLQRALRVLSHRLAVSGRRRWRRSLLVRVVAVTIAMGVVVLLVVGQLLLQRIADDLIAAAREDATNNAQQLTVNTIGSLNGQQLENEGALRSWVGQQLTDLHGPPDTPLRYVALLKELGTRAGSVNDQALGLSPGAIPASLREPVVRNPSQLMSQELTLPIRQENGSTVMSRVIVVGSLIDLGPLGAAPEEDTGRYELYFIYPLNQEVEILGVVQRTFAVGAILLLVLIGLVAWVVTRQVVAPVRVTAAAAEQLAAGNLDRRVAVRGEDELARLGRSFNEMAASLEDQINRLEELSRAQRRFVSDVSHELRTPLTTMRMAGEVLFDARSSFEPAVSRTAELLQTQLDRFESLLSDLLEVSRFDAGAVVLETERVDLRDLVSRVSAHLQPLADERGIALRVSVPEFPVVAEVDPRRIERVVRNLLGNAIEHGEGLPIDIRVAGGDSAVAIGVRDHGVGISAEDQRHVFERFWRGDPARARTMGGTGLGLAISSDDAILHGGRLEVWGEPGLGAHFRLTVPRVPGEEIVSSPLPLEPTDELNHAPANRPLSGADLV